jgi:hypothetical protein
MWVEVVNGTNPIITRIPTSEKCVVNRVFVLYISAVHYVDVAIAHVQGTPAVVAALVQSTKEIRSPACLATSFGSNSEVLKCLQTGAPTLYGFLCCHADPHMTV